MASPKQFSDSNENSLSTPFINMVMTTIFEQPDYFYEAIKEQNLNTDGIIEALAKSDDQNGSALDFLARNTETYPQIALDKLQAEFDELKQRKDELDYIQSLKDKIGQYQSTSNKENIQERICQQEHAKKLLCAEIEKKQGQLANLKESTKTALELNEMVAKIEEYGEIVCRNNQLETQNIIREKVEKLRTIHNEQISKRLSTEEMNKELKARLGDWTAKKEKESEHVRQKIENCKEKIESYKAFNERAVQVHQNLSAKKGEIKQMEKKHEEDMEECALTIKEYKASLEVYPEIGKKIDETRQKFEEGYFDDNKENRQ